MVPLYKESSILDMLMVMTGYRVMPNPTLCLLDEAYCTSSLAELARRGWAINLGKMAERNCMVFSDLVVVRDRAWKLSDMSYTRMC